MKTFLTAVTAALVAASAVPALAGGMAPVVAETAPVATYAPMAPMGADWTGFGVAIELGYGTNAFSGGTSVSGIKDGWLYGFRGTYDYDFGSWVLGGLASYDISTVDSASGGVKELGHIGMRAGADLGDNLVYATAGAAWAISNLVGSNNTDPGYFIGVGAEHKLNGGWTIGGELISNKFSNLSATGGTLTVTQINSFVRYKF